MADHRPVHRRHATEHGREGRGPRMALRLGERLEPRDHRPERLRMAALGDEALGGPDDLQGVRLALLGGRSPRGDAVTTEDAADRLRVRALDVADVQAELEARAAPRDPYDTIAEALARERRTVRGCREGDAGVGMQVVDVRAVDETVHRGVDRRCRSPGAVQAEGEGVDHLVLAVHPGVHVDERVQPIEAQDGEPRFGERAEVTAGPLHPQDLDRRIRDRIGDRALRGRVPPGVVRVARIGAEAVRPGEELGRRRGEGHGIRFRSWDADGARRPSPPGIRRCARRRSSRRIRMPRTPSSDRGRCRARSATRRGAGAHRCRRHP